MKKILIIIVTLLFAIPLKAQNFDDYKSKRKEQMQRYADSMQQSFDEFRHKANEEYAQFMRERWEAFNSLKGEPIPQIPEPPRPIERGKNEPIPNLPNPVPVQPIPMPAPAPVKPIELPNIPQPAPVPSMPKFSFTCYGTECKVTLGEALRLELNNISENSVADAWLQLSSEMGDELLHDCLRLRNEMALGDWAYLCLLKSLSENFCGKGTNEATLMQLYLLVQSGYKARIGRQNGRLVMLLPFDGPIYRVSYLQHKGDDFYVIGENESGTVNMFNQAFSDNERVMSLRMSCPPKFAYKPTNDRKLQSKRYSELSVSISVNKNLMDFYNDYPSCLWTNYSWAGLSEETKAKLYPVLREGIAGKGQIDAANRIINFVQTAFDYKTDSEQFGHERSLFGDETFFYPFSDCEDRAILFSILIRDLLGLDVVLLHYHDHLATAVCYTETLNGCHFDYDGKTYYISDPCYINANVGECAPKYLNESPKVYKL